MRRTIMHKMMMTVVVVVAASADADDGSAEIQTLAIDATPPGQAQPDATNVQLVYPRR